MAQIITATHRKAIGCLSENECDADQDIPSFIDYTGTGESVNLPVRLKHENDSSKVDGAKCNWAASQYFSFEEIVVAHVHEGNKFECLVMEAMILSFQVGVAGLIGCDGYRALTTTFDSFNEMNGGKAWINEVGVQGSIAEIVSWLIENSSHIPGEMVMSSTLVPVMIRRYFDLHIHDISQYWFKLPPEIISFRMLHLYVSQKGVIAKRETPDSAHAQPVAMIRTSRRSTQSSTSTKTSISPLSTMLSQADKEAILDKFEFQAPENTGFTEIGKTKVKKRLCRAMVRCGVTNEMIACCKISQGLKYEGYCAHHHETLEALDQPNKHEWKLSVKKKKSEHR